jgi:hypothetical protein
MKALLIIGGIVLYLVLTFFVWAFVYIGSGGHLENRRREK